MSLPRTWTQMNIGLEWQIRYQTQIEWGNYLLYIQWFILFKKRNSDCKSEYVSHKEWQTKSIKLKDGVIMYYNEYGDIKNEYPMLVFHGGLTCNLEHLLSETIAEKYNLPLSISDRPDCGRSRSPLICNNNFSNLP